MSTVVDVSISGHVAERVHLERLAPARPDQAMARGTLPVQDPSRRFRYRFVYRFTRDGILYMCRVTAAPRMALVLLGELRRIAQHATTSMDAALAVECERAIAAVARAIAQGNPERDSAMTRAACDMSNTRSREESRRGYQLAS